MSRMRGLFVLAGFGCSLVMAGAAGADQPRRPPGKQPHSIAATAARALQGYAVVSSPQIASPAGTQVYGSVQCPPGTVVLGGGVSDSSPSLQAGVNSSYPLGSQRGWQAYVNNVSDADATFSVFATCAKQPTGYRIVKKKFFMPRDLVIGGLVECPATLATVGGGGYSSSRHPFVFINSTYPIFTGRHSAWETEMSSTDVDSELTTYAICANRGLAGFHFTGVGGSNAANAQSAATVTCLSPDAVAVGGGVWSSSKELGGRVNSSYPDGNAWKVKEINSSPRDERLVAFLICLS